MEKKVKIQSWNPERGFGFAKIDGERAFVHATAIKPQQSRGVDFTGCEIIVTEIERSKKGLRVERALTVEEFEHVKEEKRTKPIGLTFFTSPRWDGVEHEFFDRIQKRKTGFPQPLSRICGYGVTTTEFTNFGSAYSMSNIREALDKWSVVEGGDVLLAFCRKLSAALHAAEKKCTEAKKLLPLLPQNGTGEFRIKDKIVAMEGYSFPKEEPGKTTHFRAQVGPMDCDATEVAVTDYKKLGGISKEEFFAIPGLGMLNCAIFELRSKKSRHRTNYNGPVKWKEIEELLDTEVERLSRERNLCKSIIEKMETC